MSASFALFILRRRSSASTSSPQLAYPLVLDLHLLLQILLAQLLLDLRQVLHQATNFLPVHQIRLAPQSLVVRMGHSAAKAVLCVGLWIALVGLVRSRPVQS